MIVDYDTEKTQEEEFELTLKAAQRKLTVRIVQLEATRDYLIDELAKLELVRESLEYRYRNLIGYAVCVSAVLLLIMVSKTIV